MKPFPVRDRAVQRRITVALLSATCLLALGSESGLARLTANANPLGKWTSTTARCTKGWCVGKSFPNPTTITEFDSITGAFSGVDGTAPVTGTVHGNATRTVYKQGTYVSISVGTISPDGTSWSGTWKDSNGASGTWSGERDTVKTVDLVGRWTLTSSCGRGCKGSGELTQNLEITSQNGKTGTFKGTLDGDVDIDGIMVVGPKGKGHTVRFRWSDPGDDGYEASWSGASVSDDLGQMSGGTWSDSKLRGGSWKASRWSGTSGAPLPKGGVKPGVGANPITTCVGANASACIGFGGLTEGQVKTCLTYFTSCENFAGPGANLIQGCVATALGACLGFGGMSHADVQVCLSYVGSCEGFGGMTPPLTAACVSYWGSCTGFGGMTPPQIQTCVGNSLGSCVGFGPSTDAQLLACVANVVSLCQGFGLDKASATSTKTIKPKAFDPWKLSCGSGTTHGGFLFGKDEVTCDEQVVVTTLSDLSAGERDLPFAPSGGPTTRNVMPQVDLPDPNDPSKSSRKAARSSQEGTATRLTLARLSARIGVGRLMVGRLAVTGRSARTYLERISKSKHPTTKLTYWLKLTVLRNGKPVKGRSLIFAKTVTVSVTSRG